MKLSCIALLLLIQTQCLNQYQFKSLEFPTYRKRYVYCFHAPEGPGLDCPLVIDPTGAYFRREGFAGHYIGGQSPPLADEPNPETLDVDYTYFDNVVWPNLAHRVPSLQNLKVTS